MKKFFYLPFILLIVLGCSDSSLYSGDVYTVGDAKTVKNVSYGRIIGLRPVTLKDKKDAEVGTVSGAVLGGVVGNTIGRGGGRNVATAGGAILGGMVGGKVGSGVGAAQAVELEIEKDSGEIIAVVQTQGTSQFAMGQRVRLVGGGSRVNVSPI